MFLSTASSTRHSSYKSFKPGPPSIYTLTGEQPPAVPPFSYRIYSIKLFKIYEHSEFSSGMYGLIPDCIFKA